MTTHNTSFTKNLIRAGFAAFLLLSGLSCSGCTSLGDGIPLQTVASMSPAPELVEPSSAMHEARDYVSAHPGTQIAWGSGDSMLPLYKDNTLIVIQKIPVSELRRGMTVVFVSKEGWPVAHALVERTDSGWVTMGIHNADPDSEPMENDNYVGVVVKAYEGGVNPMLVISRALSTEDRNVAMARPSPANALAAVQ